DLGTEVYHDKGRSSPAVCYPPGKTEMKIPNDDPNPIETAAACFALREANLVKLRKRLERRQCHELLAKCRRNESKDYTAYMEFVSNCLALFQQEDEEESQAKDDSEKTKKAKERIAADKEAAEAEDKAAEETA
ncbi:unnamed protein product, partial [Amoebophrya sp. A120]